MSSHSQHSNQKGVRGSFNSQNCSDKPHFGPCNHGKGKRLCSSNASQIDESSNQLRLNKSHSSRHLVTTSQQRPCLRKPTRKQLGHMTNSA